MCECVYVGGEAGVKEAEGVENLKLNTQRQLKQWQKRTPATTPTSRGYNYYFSVFTMLLVSFFFIGMNTSHGRNVKCVCGMLRIRVMCARLPFGFGETLFM